MPKDKQYLLYNKICIVCMGNFQTTRITTLCCKKQCRNRLRYYPQKLINSLVERVSRFTTFKRYGDSIVSSPQILSGQVFESPELKHAVALARDEARRRGIKVSSIVDDNLDFINTTDPANGDSTGFKKQEEIHNDNDFVNGNSVSHAPVNGESENSNGSNGNASTISSSSIAGEFPRGKGIRKIGVSED